MRKIHKTGGNSQMMNDEIISVLVVITFTLSGCSAPIRQSAVPRQLTEKAEVVGLPGMGYLIRDVMPAFTRDAMESFYREQVYLAGQSQNVQLPPVNFQAIIDFNLAYIPKSFNVPQREEFDT